MAEEEHVKLKGKIADLGCETWVNGAIIKEGLGRLTDTTVQFVTDKAIKLKDLVGQPMHVEVTDHLIDDKRNFGGVCISVESIGKVVYGDGMRFSYVAKVRHWLWMLKRASNNRVFQNMTAVQIIEDVFGQHGFSDFEKKLRETYEEREYCVQYRETDFDFVSRLMQEEGIYYFFDNALGKDPVNKLILCDDASGSHVDNPGQSELKYTGSGGREAEAGDKITDWSHSENVVTGKVTLNDYDMLTPLADQKVVEETIVQASHTHKSYEYYHYPAKYRKDTARGQRLAKVRMQAEEVKFQTRRAAANTRSVAVGYKFSLTDSDGDDGTFLVSGATHYIKPTHSANVDPGRLDKNREDLQYPEELEKTDYVVYFEAVPDRLQFRSPLITPWPEISGLHTALVVGKSGEEIWTDDHGRIKVQFPWDREGEKNENSSCWIRVVTPWSGKDWGMVAIPRMGQEVVIQFEEGDPDRPICTGMLWNEDTKPAFKYPDDATQLGIRSNSSKGGGGYNELMFEDKKDAEIMRMQAQKDHQFLIKNKSVTTIGLEEINAGDHDEDGSLSEVIRNHVTRSIQEGNHYFTIEAGDEEIIIDQGTQTIEIEGDKTETIRTGNHVHTVQTGNMETTVDTGNHETTVSTGNHGTTVSTGNLSVDVSLGKSEHEAMQSIEFKVGSNSIKIDQTGVTIKGIMVKIEGMAMVEAKAPATQIKGDAMVKIQGGITMIN